MTQDLLIDMYYAAPELWYVLGVAFVLLAFFGIYQLFQTLKLRQKNYFLNRDRERYAETLYASKDGYFAFIYPDQKVNDPRSSVRERCSRRLSVILNLEDGTNSNYEQVLQCFYKDDAKKIQKYVDMLKEEGVSFEDEFMLKGQNKHIRLSGVRINGIDGNVYCDMIWFRDVSFEKNLIMDLESQKVAIHEKLENLDNLINNIPYPLWLRNENLDIVVCNKKFVDYSGAKNKIDVVHNGIEISTVNGESLSKKIALLAKTTNKAKKCSASVVVNGQRIAVDAFETPFYSSERLDKIATSGILIDVSELDELKRNFKLHQNAQLEILGTLGTGFAVFDNQFKLAFYNQSFVSLWGLDNLWLESQPTYAMFLDVLREKRMLPEVSDFLAFKNGEQKAFSSIIEAKQDYLYLPNERTIRRLRNPHPMGGLIFAYEDVSDNLATSRAYQGLLQVQQETLDNLFDAVLIFSSAGYLKLYNQQYIKLWNANNEFLQTQPSMAEVIDSHKGFFTKTENWDILKDDILKHIYNLTTKSFILNRDNTDEVEVLSSTLSDGSIMITYKQVGN